MKAPADIHSSQLPSFPLLAQGSQGMQEVEAFVRDCLLCLRLTAWDFGWDNAIRRLGCCHPKRKRITLSRHFVCHFQDKDQGLIRKTILHELAHALAWEHNRSHGHGATWRHFCTLLGIPGEKASTSCEDFQPNPRPEAPRRYALCHKETQEVFRYYARRPRIPAAKLAHAYITGRKKETLGMLCIVPLQP